MENQGGWKPKEIIVHERIKDDPVAENILRRCPNVPVHYTNGGQPKHIIRISSILSGAGNSMLDKILAGKQVLYVAPATNDTVDIFTMPDKRMMCPHFHRLKLASNGCFYQCDWCYLKLTYRAAFPFITVRAEYDKTIENIDKKLSKSQENIIFNSGELADSLSMEHLTDAAKTFIPWFAHSKNGYLFMLTKSDNVDGILNLNHNKHTIIAWSMNNDRVSRKFEIGAPPFERRLEAAHKVQQAGYPLRIRLDPIVPFDEWQMAYADTIKQIFNSVAPDRITIGTLRFEKGFYDMRNTFFTSGPELPGYLEHMIPMFEPKVMAGSDRPKSGKYSFSEQKRIEIFKFIIDEIRKYSDCLIALCKESANLWNELNLDLTHCSCVCQLDHADMSVSNQDGLIEE